MEISDNNGRKANGVGRNMLEALLLVGAIYLVAYCSDKGPILRNSPRWLPG